MRMLKELIVITIAIFQLRALIKAYECSILNTSQYYSKSDVVFKTLFLL